jgi:hypothetical protein
MSINTKDYYTGNPQPQIYPQSIGYVDNGCMRFTDKNNNQGERILQSNYWREQINLYGQQCLYYVNTYSTLSADNLYGEQPTQQFAPPLPFVIALNLNENALMLSKYGLLSEDEVTGFVHISAFYATFNGTEPKSGDVFQLTEYGNDRPGGRNGKFFEITERLDEDAATINPLGGHYVWLIKAKRFEWSFEPGLSADAVNSQVYDDTRNTAASGAYKPYDYSADVEVKAKTFDYTVQGFDSVYGGYM